MLSIFRTAVGASVLARRKIERKQFSLPHPPPLPFDIGIIIYLGFWERRARSPTAERYLLHFGLKMASVERNFTYIFTKNTH